MVTSHILVVLKNLQLQAVEALKIYLLPPNRDGHYILRFFLDMLEIVKGKLPGALKNLVKISWRGYNNA